jgi:RNA polymerase sigma-70 factor (ECF subfamily)
VANETVSLHIEPERESLSGSEDHALLASLRSGADDAYETLICRFQQPVYNLVYRLMNDPADAADVTQEVFLKIFRKICSFKGNSSLKTWIYRVAVNEAYNHRRWFSRHHRHEIGLTREEDSRVYESTFADRGRSPFDVTLDHETRALIEDALARLNPNFRAVVVLRDIEDLSYEEIAVVLDISLGTVKSRILRGREALRKLLEAQFEPEPSLGWSPQAIE